MTSFKTNQLSLMTICSRLPGQKLGVKNQQPDWFHTKASDEKLYVCNKDAVKSEGYFPSPEAQRGVNNPANRALHAHTHRRKQI